MSSFIAVEDVLDDGQVYGQSSRDLHIHFNHSLTWQVNGRCYCELTLAKQACEDGNNWLLHLSLVQDNMAIESRKFFVMRTGSSKTQTGLAMDGTGIRKLGKPNVSSAIAAIMP
ncbi:hypothetical protein VTP01DRAFT_143 [Rhizomucor pusillus]|uniref:uncharacterized protein n=1 Tax=Rhizomucor pusillus TaxID=4840 RepID=UPI003743E3E0